MVTFRGWILVFILIATGGLQADDGWVGKEVIPKRGTPEISRTDENGNVIVLGKIDYFPVPVREEKGDWVKVQVRDVAGWIAKDKLVRMNEGIQYFTDRINSKDDLKEAYECRAWLWGMKKEPDIAIKDADEAIRIKASAGTYNTRGHAWSIKKDYDKAIDDYTEAVRLDAKYALAWLNRGIAWAAKKEYDKAIDDDTEAIRLDPKMCMAFYSRGIAWHEKKDYANAIKDYIETIRLDPKFKEAFYSRGLTWYNKKDYDNAIHDYTEAINLDAKYVSAINNLAWLYATCPGDKYRDGKRALELAKKACELTNWKNADYIDTLAAAYAETGDFDQAIKYQKQALSFPEFEKENSDTARKQLKLYEANKPLRE